MAPSSSPDPGGAPSSLDAADAELLLDAAEEAVTGGLAGEHLHLPDLTAVAPALRRPAGNFVTLHVRGDLNGCIGSVEAGEPLIHGVARHARAAAFDDPRLPVLTHDDLTDLEIEVSVLSPLDPIAADDRESVVGTLRPGVDGLVLDARGRRAVFLPSVWARLRSPARFVAELLAKAGLRGDRWPDGVRAWTFTTESVTRPASAGPAGAPTTVR